MAVEAGRCTPPLLNDCFCGWHLLVGCDGEERNWTAQAAATMGVLKHDLLCAGHESPRARKCAVWAFALARSQGTQSDGRPCQRTVDDAHCALAFPLLLKDSCTPTFGNSRPCGHSCEMRAAMHLIVASALSWQRL